MSQHSLVSSQDEIVNTMIDLAHLSRSHRIVLGGDDSTRLYLALKRRGFSHPVLAAAGRPRGPHAAALIAGDRSFEAIEAALTQILGFLGADANIAVAIESEESGVGVKVRNKLRQFGFRIEAGARCRNGFVLAAHRENFGQAFGTVAKVA